MERSQLIRGVLDASVLATLDVRDSYGYDIQRSLALAGLDGLGEATIYGTLRRLYKSGAVSTYAVPSDEGPNRRYYAMTDTGRALLEAARGDWNTFRGAVDAVLAPNTTGAPS